MRYDDVLNNASDLFVERVVLDPHAQERYLRLAADPEPEIAISETSGSLGFPKRCARSVDEIVKALLPRFR